MRPSFHPRLVNNPFEDPGLYIPFFLNKRAVLFDLGNIHPLSPRDILKLTHVFVTHTHMDHFIGFDYLLRLFLGREKELHLFGPRGFIDNIEGKLSGYTWNLVSRYPNRFSLNVTEIDTRFIRTKRYVCQNQFRPDEPPLSQPFNPTLIAEPAISITCAILDHKVDSLGFSLSEKFHINIMKAGLDRLQLPVGSWLKVLKEKLHGGEDLNQPMEIPSLSKATIHRKYTLKELAEQIALISPGQKITYITDAAGSPANIETIIELAYQSHHLFIETHFLERDRHLAEETHHLTARTAGIIARKAEVLQCTPFHFSPRYIGSESLIFREIADAAGPNVMINQAF